MPVVYRSFNYMRSYEAFLRSRNFRDFERLEEREGPPLPLTDDRQSGLRSRWLRSRKLEGIKVLTIVNTTPSGDAKLTFSFQKLIPNDHVVI